MAITTADPQFTNAQIVPLIAAQETENYADHRPVLQWDVFHGLIGANNAGKSIYQAIIGAMPKPQGGNPFAHDQSGPQFTHPMDLLRTMATQMPPGAALVTHNLHRWWMNADVCQAVQSLRDLFKVTNRVLYALIPVGAELPVELQYDFVILHEPRPSDEALEQIILEQCQYAETPQPPTDAMHHYVNAIRGIPAGAAENQVALSMNGKGINLDRLRQHQREIIGNTPGLAIYRGTETFADIGGLNEVKFLLKSVLTGRRPATAIVLIDEIEKSAAGFGSDSSGVSQDIHGVLLKYLADHDQTGLILIGAPGTGKSFLAKAAGNEVGIPTITFDIGAMKDPKGLVGGSEYRIRTAMATIHGVSGGEALFLATCNNLQALSPELRSRFRLGVVYHDLPDNAEKAGIWELQKAKFPELDFPGHDDARPSCQDWTGREIAACAELAWRMNITLLEASRRIVPMAQTAPEKITELRAEAHDRYLSASYPGVFHIHETLPEKKRQYNVKR